MTTEMNDHEAWTGRLSAFLDGGLDADVRDEMEEHLAGCGSCRRVLEELREVKRRAGELGDVPPSRDLWAGIAATLQAPPAEAEGARVIALPTAARASARPPADDGVTGAPTRRRISFSAGQLAAASLALIAVSSGVAWAAAGAAVDAGDTASPVATRSHAGVLAPAANVVEPPAELARELARLEATVVEARGVLDPNTVRVLERNLGIIEQAIEDSQRALAQDPENDFLVEHLQRVYERKLEYLRDAARVAERSS